uniref:Uncharacterized protein n=1 Tax=Oryza sativa subsp. japonica TaxID=39947 RepID=Q5Z883_ORYSJ|nr:hypothetical protein [Oryza sativa Japonica Group]BAD61761.1 hypothetical protein [Oryza sativa Japonica Group]
MPSGLIHGSICIGYFTRSRGQMLFVANNMCTRLCCTPASHRLITCDTPASRHRPIICDVFAESKSSRRALQDDRLRRFYIISGLHQLCAADSSIDGHSRPLTD